MNGSGASYGGLGAFPDCCGPRSAGADPAASARGPLNARPPEVMAPQGFKWPLDPAQYPPTISETWAFVRGYRPWIEELKLALGDFGRDTGHYTRLGEVVRVGDILKPTQCTPCPCANTPWNQKDWYAIAAQFAPPGQKTTLAKINMPVCAPPTDVEDCGRFSARAIDDDRFALPANQVPVNFLHDLWPRPPKSYTYFVYYSARHKAYIGRSFFQCERSGCSQGEAKDFVITDFRGFEYYGNLVDTPEKLLVTESSEIPGAITPEMLKYGSSYLARLKEERKFVVRRNFTPYHSPKAWLERHFR